MKFWDFPDISLFPKILCVNSFGNSRGNNDILARTSFIFQKKCSKLKLKGFQYQIWTSVKDRQSSFQLKQISVIFSKLATLILGQNNVRRLRGTKIDKQFNFGAS